MRHISFSSLSHSVEDIEKMYKNGTIKYGDIVFQQYTDNYSHLFMNGTWIKSIYNSELNSNNEIEDDVYILSSSIDSVSKKLDNTSIRLNDVSTRLSTDYINQTQYLNDSSIIANTFTELNNKIDNIDITHQLEDVYTSISELNKGVTDVSLSLYNLTETENINSTIDTFKEVEEFLNNISDSSTLTELLLNTKDVIIDDLSEQYCKKDVVNNVSADLNDVSTRLLSDYINHVQYLDDESLIASTFADLNIKINSNTTDIRKEIILLKNRLSDYINHVQYLDDESLIASTFADLNNKINNIGKVNLSNYYSIEQVDEKIASINTVTNEISTNLNNSSLLLNDVSTRLSTDYINKTQYLDDKSFISSSLVELNNKIESLQQELNKIKAQ